MKRLVERDRYIKADDPNAKTEYDPWGYAKMTRADAIAFFVREELYYGGSKRSKAQHALASLGVRDSERKI